MKKLFAVVAGSALLAGCATFDSGSTQGITLTSNVDSATCSISRNGVEIASAAQVPVTHQIERRPGDLLVTCSADGYETAKVGLVNGKHPMTVTGILLTGVLFNVGTDAISHSWHEAQSAAYVHLVKS